MYVCTYINYIKSATQWWKRCFLFFANESQKYQVTDRVPSSHYTLGTSKYHITFIFIRSIKL